MAKIITVETTVTTTKEMKVEYHVYSGKLTIICDIIEGRKIDDVVCMNLYKNDIWLGHMYIKKLKVTKIPYDDTLIIAIDIIE